MYIILFVVIGVTMYFGFKFPLDYKLVLISLVGVLIIVVLKIVLTKIYKLLKNRSKNASENISKNTEEQSEKETYENYAPFYKQIEDEYYNKMDKNELPKVNQSRFFANPEAPIDQTDVIPLVGEGKVHDLETPPFVQTQDAEVFYKYPKDEDGKKTKIVKNSIRMHRGRYSIGALTEFGGY